MITKEQIQNGTKDEAVELLLQARQIVLDTDRDIDRLPSRLNELRIDAYEDIRRILFGLA